MLRTILLGSPAGQQTVAGGPAQFILFVLHYRSLILRLGLAAAVWALASLGWPFVAKLGFLALEIYASLIMIRIVAGASQLGQSGRILIAMWLPIAVIAVAVYLLFVNEQGRELGIGLMDPN